MKTNRILVGVLLLGLVLGLAIGPGLAQGPGLQDSDSPQVAVGTAFTYQGRLTNSAGPLDDDCDFRFSLWSRAGSGEPPTGGTQIGAVQTKTNVAVRGGLFTIPNLNFGGAAFTGAARWLQIAVRCPTGSGDYTTLAPRQALTPAPYALALPGLWTQQDATSPNIIGGYSGNNVADGVYGATISGGGEDGNPNSVSQRGGTIGGGSGNTASGIKATIGGGSGNEASNASTTVSGGLGNQASGYRASVGGGESNIASEYTSTIGGGRMNAASGSLATIGGGSHNEASGNSAVVPGGRYAVASHYGEMAFASGDFTSQGDAQTSVYVLRNNTYTATPTELFLDGGGERLTIASGRTVIFDVLLTARTSAGESMGCTFQGVIDNVSGTTAFVQAPGKICHKGGLTWDANLVADDANDALKIEVTGTGASIRWVARVQTAEVSW